MIAGGVECIAEVIKDSLLERAITLPELDAQWQLAAGYLGSLAFGWWDMMMNGVVFDDENGDVIEYPGEDEHPSWWLPSRSVDVILAQLELQLKAAAARRCADSLNAGQPEAPTQTVQHELHEAGERDSEKGTTAEEPSIVTELSAERRKVDGLIAGQPEAPTQTVQHEPHEAGEHDSEKRTTAEEPSATELSAERHKVIDPLLDAKGWSPAQLAKAAKVEPATIYDYLSGKTRRMQRETRLKVAKALGITPSELPN